MPVLIPGYTYEQKTVTVAANDAAMNAEITTQAATDWIVSQLVLNSANMTILFNRQVADVAP